MTTTNTPHFTHDCNNCIYLGTHSYVNHTTKQSRLVYHDYYICDKTVLARFGNAPGDYFSTTIDMLTGLNGHLAIAAMIAAKKNLINLNNIKVSVNDNWE